jgi:hypothetical protein
VQITDQFSMTLHSVDKSSFICRIAHSLAYQMLVAGFFCGLLNFSSSPSPLTHFLHSLLLLSLFIADPHPGNVYCVEGRAHDFGSYPSPSKNRGLSSSFNGKPSAFVDSSTSSDDSWRPGFLDFGMTHRYLSPSLLPLAHSSIVPLTQR